MSDEPTSTWPKYESHKIVRAAKIVSIHNDFGQGEYFLWVDPGTGKLEKFTTSVLIMMVKAEVGGWAVIYEPDEKNPAGYRSVSPRKAFEEGYTKVEA